MNNEESQAAEPADNISPGAQLTAARERMGLTRQQVADRLKLRLISIKAIEEDDVEEGVSTTFTKGYVRLYAKLVGIEAQPLLEAFDKIHQNETSNTKLQSFSRRVEREANDSRWNLVTYVVIILVVASLAFWWYDQQGYSLPNFNQEPQDSSLDSNEVDIQSQLFDDENPSVDQAGSALADNTETQGSNIVDDGTASLDASLDPIDESLSEDEDDASQQTPVTEQPQESDETTEQTNNDNPVAEEESGNASGEVEIVFTFKQDCWLSVTDANDETIAVGVKKQGRVMTITALPPVKVNLCPTEKVSIVYDSQALDLSRFGVGSPVVFTLPLESN